MMQNVFYYVEKVAAYSHNTHWITHDLEEAICAAKRLARQDVDDHHRWYVKKFKHNDGAVHSVVEYGGGCGEDICYFVKSLC